MGSLERVRDGVKGQPLLGLRDRDAQPSLQLIEVELEEGAALALDCDRLSERAVVAVFIELDQQLVGLALYVRDGRGETGISVALVANSGFVKSAGRYPSGPLEGVAGRWLRWHRVVPFHSLSA